MNNNINPINKDDSKNQISIPTNITSQKAWDIARERYKILEPILGLDTIPKNKIKDLCNELKISRSTLFRLVKKYKDSAGAVNALAPQPPPGGVGKKRINHDVEKIIAELIEKIYLNKQRNSIKSVIMEVRRQCVQASLKAPSKNTIHRRINLLSARYIIEKRKGKLSAHSFTPNIGPSVSADYSMQSLMLDHTKVDLIVVDEFQRQPIGRPWLTVAIDIYSRCITGFYLSFDAPSSLSVGLCLVNSIFSKEDYLRRMEIEGNWPVFGKPDNLYIDQGAEFKSEAFIRGCEQNGIKIFWRRVGSPHLHGIIERLIGSLMKEVHTLPGTTFSNPIDRGMYKSNNEAVLTLKELEKWLLNVIVGQYNLDIHSNINEAPLTRYRQGLEIRSSSLISVTNEKVFLIDFLPLIKRTIQRDGFVIDNIHYFNNALVPWISQRNKKVIFNIRRDPRDLSRIYVLHPKESHYLEIPYKHMGRPSITLWEHRESLRRIRERKIFQYDESTIFKTISEMRKIVDIAKLETKNAKRKNVKNETIFAQMSTEKFNKIKKENVKVKEKVELKDIKPFDEIEEW